MLYRGTNCTGCQLTFSETSLKFEGLTVNGTRKKFSFERTVGDIISIDAKWYETVSCVSCSFYFSFKPFEDILWRDNLWASYTAGCRFKQPLLILFYNQRVLKGLQMQMKLQVCEFLKITGIELCVWCSMKFHVLRESIWTLIKIYGQKYDHFQSITLCLLAL